VTTSRYLACGAIAIAIYTVYVLVSRSFGWSGAVLDWVFLLLSVLSVLLWPSVRGGNRNNLLLLMGGLLVILILWTFWILAKFFGEGL